jgi:hypothetical protein
MKKYIDGYYCRDDLHLQVINKDSNRKILEALRKAYPDGLTVEELSKKTRLPVKTIYAQKAELYREYYINHLEEQDGVRKLRGRPSVHASASSSPSMNEVQRKRVRIVLEDTSGFHDPYEGKKPTPLPPGNVVYENGFTDAWDRLVVQDQEEILYRDLLQFIQGIFIRMDQEIDWKENERPIRKWIPERTVEYCCTQCGLNHETRDFIRAILLRLIDKFETNDKFVDFLKDNQMLTQEAYEQGKGRIRAMKKR